MAEDGYEPYHVPQQSRRDKLRVVAQQNHHHHHHGCVDNLQGCASLLPLYDPSLIPSDLLTSANLHHHHHHQQSSVKEEGGGGGGGVNFMGFVGGGGLLNTSSSSSTSHHHLYSMDPQSSSVHINPSSIQEITNNPFLYTPQNLRVFDHHQSFNGACDVVTHHHEPNPNGQGLSLSLSSNHAHQSNLPLELNLQRYDPSIFNNKVSTTGGGGGVGYVVPAIVGGGGGGGPVSNDASRSSVPLGPFTGYTSILKGSRFLKPAQQLLEELCSRGIYGLKITEDSSLVDSPMDQSLGDSGDFYGSLGSGDGRKKSKLISMLDEVYRRYKHYYQQMQAVIASFESVAGLSNAAPYANLALKAMSKHFKCLKNAIADQLQFTRKVHSQMNYRKDESPRLENSDRCIYSQRPVNNSGYLEHQPVWRPQRGLPERAVSVLRTWLFEHFLHPYPTDTDKLMLAKQTGLSRSQVSNWFINARVRLWKPMVEEIHTLETRQASKASEREEQNADRASDHFPTAPSTSSQRTQDLRPKRTRNDISDVSIMTSEEAMNLSYENLSRHSHAGMGVGAAVGSGGVSLTLGLHQNNGLVNLSEPFQVNAGQRFGLDANSDGYVIGSFEAPNRQFGRDIMGGQLLHDFVG